MIYLTLHMALSISNFSVQLPANNFVASSKAP